MRINVHGAGIFGLSIAWELSRRGADVQIVETARPGAGASGGVVGALAPHTPDRWNAKKQFQLDGLLAAADWWARVDETGGGCSGYARIGRVQPLADQRGVDLAHARVADAAANWGAHALWQVVQDPELGDWTPASATGHYLHDTLSARLNPAGAIASLCAALTTRGVEFTDAPRACDATVLATGAAGLADLTAELGHLIGNGVKGQAALLAADSPADLPQIYADGLHVVPHGDGRVGIGSTSERDWTHDGPDEQLDEIIVRARDAVPALRDAPVVQRWAGIRPRARSRSPLLGSHPLRDGVFVANGGFKIGFGIAPSVGRAMADLILTGKNGIPPEFGFEALDQTR